MATGALGQGVQDGYLRLEKYFLKLLLQLSLLFILVLKMFAFIVSRFQRGLR